MPLTPPLCQQPQPIYEMSVANCRLLDQRAANEFGIPSIVLMENAAIALCTHALHMLKTSRNQSILIACGPGNNAGDGFALARHLHNQSLSPTIIMTAPRSAITGDAKINLDIITKMGITIIAADEYLQAQNNQNTNSTPPLIPGLIIDALFGTGLTRPITGTPADLINHINTQRSQGALVLAVDVPSGLNAQTGSPIGDAVITADRTVTFAALKEGYRSIEAQPYLGETHTANIGLPISLLESLGTPVHPPQGSD